MLRAMGQEVKSQREQTGIMEMFSRALNYWLIDRRTHQPGLHPCQAPSEDDNHSLKINITLKI